MIRTLDRKRLRFDVSPHVVVLFKVELVKVQYAKKIYIFFADLERCVHT